MANNSLLQSICWSFFFGIAYKMATRSTRTLIIKNLAGADDKMNQILFTRPVLPASVVKTLIYFGGDVQDFEANMLKHRDNKKYAHWSLEKTAQLLGDACPDCQIVIVRPSRIELQTFSCYSNFVDTDKLGNPSHKFGREALNHLNALMLSLSSEMNVELGEKILVGFSKGVVVLNQLVYDMHGSTSDADEAVKDLIASISKMCWLDGGHNGGKETWVTNSAVLGSFAQRGIDVDIRVTPYMVRDDRRPWIKQEEKKFQGVLSRAGGVKIRRNIYFEDKEVGIEEHFEVLKTLKDEPL